MNRYVDFSATNNGDGTSAAQASSPGGVGAFNRYALADYTAGSVYNIWVRRLSGYTLPGSLILNQADIHIIGWPVLGDPDYTTRPSVPSWDADVQEYAQLDGSVAVSVTTSSGQIFRRVKFNNTSFTASVACEINSCSLPTCTISAAVYSRECLFNGSTTISGNAVIFGGIATGSVQFTGYSDAHFVTSTGGLSLNAPCRVTVDNLSGNVSIVQGAKLYVTNGSYTYTQSTIGHPGIFNLDKRVNKYATCVKSDNVRSGGAPFSIVGTSYGFYTVPLEIGEEGLFVKLLPGSRTLTVYYTTLTEPCYVWFSVEYFASGSLTKTTASSYLDSSSDHSAWVHPGTFIKKTSLTISVGQLTLAPIRIFLREGAQTLTYIDPQVVVT